MKRILWGRVENVLFLYCCVFVCLCLLTPKFLVWFITGTHQVYLLVHIFLSSILLAKCSLELWWGIRAQDRRLSRFKK